jgi:hypothetical protein
MYVYIYIYMYNRSEDVKMLSSVPAFPENTGTASHHLRSVDLHSVHGHTHTNTHTRAHTRTHTCVFLSLSLSLARSLALSLSLSISLDDDVVYWYLIQ